MRNETDLRQAMDRHGDMVWRLCVLHLKNYADAEDVFQTVFMKYTMRTTEFENEAHEKAWLIRVSINACRDILGSFFRTHTVPLEQTLQEQSETNDENQAVLGAVMRLPKKYRDAVYLHYYEGYTAKQIGKILGKKESTVYTLLYRAREQLRKMLEENENG